MKRLFNFITSEFFRIFNPVFFGLLTLSLAIKFAKIYETGGFNLPVFHIVLTILLVIPSVTVVIMPIAFLISISVTTTKLCSTTELIALQSSGISATKVFRIYLIITAVMLIFFFTITLFIKPSTSMFLRSMISAVSSGSTNISPIEKNFSKISENLYLYCDRSDKELEKAILFHYEREGNSTIIFSKWASLSDKNNFAFIFHEGEFLKTDGESVSFMNFNTLSYNPFSESRPNEANLSKGALSTITLWEKIKDATATNPEKTEFINRFVSPLSLLIFLFLSFPFSLGHSRNYKTSGITISIIVGLLYFVLTSFVSTFSLKGFTNPFIAITFANTFLLILSIFTFYKKVWNKA